MGCGASSKVVDFDPLATKISAVAEDEPESGQEVAHQSTLRSWTAIPIPGVPCPPNRTMHERHVVKMEQYMTAVEIEPDILAVNAACKRVIFERRQEQISALENSGLSS
mmetsp:Transcript_30698/g.49409  ORF Transcript_30698/g.49409 Transcript_30698/m.49409 type:complete len:109 (+) Transcript_30698:35-361(+)